MPFFCKPASAAAALKARGLPVIRSGVSLRLLLVDKQTSPHGHLAAAALGEVHVVKFDSDHTNLTELVQLIREAHRQNQGPFESIAVAQHGADPDTNLWTWASDCDIDLNSVHGALDQLTPVVEVLAAALSKTRIGRAHVDFLACGLATACKGLVPALEKMHGIDFRASTDDTGNDVNGGDWKMETDNDYCEQGLPGRRQAGRVHRKDGPPAAAPKG